MIAAARQERSFAALRMTGILGMTGPSAWQALFCCHPEQREGSGGRQTPRCRAGPGDRGGAAGQILRCAQDDKNLGYDRTFGMASSPRRSLPGGPSPAVPPRRHPSPVSSRGRRPKDLAGGRRPRCRAGPGDRGGAAGQILRCAQGDKGLGWPGRPDASPGICGIIGTGVEQGGRW